MRKKKDSEKTKEELLFELRILRKKYRTLSQQKVASDALRKFAVKSVETSFRNRF